ncbi:MAG: glycine cleavage system protein GcvH [Bifidobacteriaceae bacterium]|jgi:glycine cleavage system H protein|nr:glycine cleavage system protein GcvH [Bifidobacteriaceae bacterium]
MNAIPPDLMYTAEHEWVSGTDGPPARVGSPDFAAEALGDVVFLELPPAGAQVVAGVECGEIESTKSVSPLFSPVTGEVTQVNQAVLDAPELVNQDPYGEGWLFAVAAAAPPDLLDAAAYAALTAAG